MANGTKWKAEFDTSKTSEPMVVPSYFQNSCNYTDLTSPSIMESIDTTPSLILAAEGQSTSNTNNSSKQNFQAININKFMALNLNTLDEENSGKSFLLLNEREQLKVSSWEEFVEKLVCTESTKVKVISIFGNTGDGKSYTLNQTFFNGGEIFPTSNEQSSCTVGVWAAFDHHLNIICLDTEGLLGSTSNENQRTRMLLKVLAISDIVIYRTRSERLHRDLFTFLGTASRAYTHHFHSALQSVNQRAEYAGALSALGPAVIIFHETRHTKTLKPSKDKSCEDVIRERFGNLSLDIDAFSSLKYIGVETINPPTSFKELRNAVIAELDNTTVRSSRCTKIVYEALKALNNKFSGEIDDTQFEISFPDEYFRCSTVCLSCENRCTLSMGHLTENLPHFCSNICKYQHQYTNYIYMCKTCYSNGKEMIVEPKYISSSETSWFSYTKYVWSGYLMECPHHGEIYRSRQFWYGNVGPESSAVRVEIKHIWPGDESNGQQTQNSAQRVIDGVASISDAVYNASSEPSRYLSSWVADRIAPSYWQPNSDLKCCSVCERQFSSEITKHHCRRCGKGTCKRCSNNQRPVPERGWHYPVRICDNCFNALHESKDGEDDVSSDDAEVLARKVSEAVVNTFSTVASVLEYPKALIKDSARPHYWVPDDKIVGCNVCKRPFTSETNVSPLRLHHCRDCGNGVCSECSSKRIPVPHRGWNHPVRVCDNCFKNSNNN